MGGRGGWGGRGGGHISMRDTTKQPLQFDMSARPSICVYVCLSDITVSLCAPITHLLSTCLIWCSDNYIDIFNNLLKEQYVINFKSNQKHGPEIYKQNLCTPNCQFWLKIVMLLGAWKLVF